MALQGPLRFKIGEKQQETIRTRTWELFGFGCYYAWLLSVVIGGCFFPEDSSIQWMIGIRLGFAFGLAVGYVLLFLLRRHPLTLDITKEKIVLAGLSATIGTSIVALPIDGAANIMVTIVASLLTGTGNAFLMMAGGKFWSTNRSEMAMMQLSASMVSAIALFYLLASLPSSIRIPLICLLPLACGLILFFSKGSKQRKTETEKRVDLFAGTLETRFALCIFAVSLAFGCVFGISTSTIGDGLPTTARVLLIGPACVTLCALLLALRTVPIRVMKLTMKVATFLLVLGIPLSLSIEYDTLIGTIGLMVFVGGYVLFDEFLWLLHSELIYRSGLPAAEIVPRFEMIQWTGIALGGSVALGIGLLGDGSNPSPAIVILVCGTLLITTLLLVFGPSDVSHIIEIRERYESRPTLKERCEITARRYGLSPRELEVLTLLARGRSAAYIQDEFCIAQGTVKVHIRHIYEKTGVKGKQELINLVDAIEESGTS